MDRGSVLVEQVVAIALLGLLLVGVFSLLATGSLAARLARELSTAGNLAAEKLEDVIQNPGAPAVVSREPVDRERFPRYEWGVGVTEVAPALRQVTVTVWWPQRGRERSVSLTTLVRQQEER